MKKSSRFCALALVLVTTLALAVGTNRRRPFRSIKAPAETIANYDVVLPRITQKDNTKPYPDKIKIFVSTSAANFTLHLELNRNLLPPNFESISYDEHGKEVVTKGHVNCFYHGEVEEYPEWAVAMSLCHGIQGSFGDLLNSEVYYHMEPLDPLDKSLDQPHALYLASEYTPHQGTCGSEHDHDHDVIGLPYLGNLTDGSNGRLRRQGRSLFVEWLIVNDFAQFGRFGNNLENTVQRAIEIANFVNMLYQQLPQNVIVVLTQVITWTNGDQISITPDPSPLLTRFRDNYTPPNPNYDTRMLITGIDLTGSTVGIAFTRTMCSFSSVGVSQDRGSAVDGVGSTAAHEMGHIFNMAHDSSPRTGCNCQDPSGNCIMAAISGFPSPSEWSQCSIIDLDDGLNNLNLGRCLDNEPTMIVGDPVCGNGIREGDEVCDCGSPQECTDSCCNAQTCQLASGAECSAGLCCQSNCQFRLYGTTCRAASGQCDITEYCSGDSTECPADVNLQDGTACSSNGNQGYCFDGACPTHDDQCLFNFGSASGMAVQECYSNYNMRGDQFGNCGHTATQFLQCSAGNVLCGQLQCITGTYQNTADVSVTIGSGSVFISSTRSSAPCQSFTTQPGADIMSPGLVLDGTRCGNERLCFEQQCVPLSQLSVQPCGTGSNGLVCSGNGQCNNLGQCSCNVGQTGSVCQTPTSGPGSGPVNECLNNNGGCAQICVDTTTSFTCSCNAGFTLASNGLSCNDINECSTNNGGCEGGCVNQQGSHRCTCGSGFRLAGNARSCDDIIECNTNNGGCSHTCINTVGSFRCSCPTGFRLSGDGRTCTDINECTEGTSGCTQSCSNTQGSFQCGCNNGFTLDGDGRTCVDNNECSNSNGGCLQTCINEPGSFRCSCLGGFQLESDGRSCRDIIECNTDNGGCDQTCTNSAGSFSCSCDSGFTLDSDGKTCKDIIECNNNNGGCNQVCTNNAGSFQCSCELGFQLGSNGLTCTAVNQCEEGSHNCDQLCANNGGTFTCSCENGFILGSDQRTCNEIDECAENIDGCEEGCDNTEGSFMCTCSPGFRVAADGRACADMNECVEQTDNCAQDCFNQDGSYTCGCFDGFELNTDGSTCISVTTGEIVGPNGLIITNNTVVPDGGDTNSEGDNQKSSAVPIIAGAVAGVVVLIVVVIVIVLAVLLVKRKRRKSGGRTYRPPSDHHSRKPLHNPQPLKYLSSTTNSQSNLLDGYPSSTTNSQSNLLDAFEPSEQVTFNPVPTPAYKPPSYTPPTTKKTGGSSQPATGQARRAPPAPPTQAHTPARQAPAPPRYEAPPKPAKPDLPAKSVPPTKPSKPVAPPKPAVATFNPVIASSKPPVASAKPTAKLPVASTKPAPIVPSNKPKPPVQPRETKPSTQAPPKPTPAPKPVPTVSKLPVQWLPPPPQQDTTSNSSGSSTSAKKPLAPPKKPLVPPRK